MEYLTKTQMAFVNSGTNEFNSANVDSDDLENLFNGERIVHPVTIPEAREPRRIYDMDSIHRWLTEHHSEPFTRELIPRDFRLSTVRDLNPNSTYNYEALVQAERDHLNGGIDQVGRERDHVDRQGMERVQVNMQEVHAAHEELRRQEITRLIILDRQRRARNMQILNRTAFERRVPLRYDILPPHVGTSREWESLITEHLGRLNRGIFLLRGSDPDYHSDLVLRIGVADEMVREGCEMVYIEFVSENRSFIVTKKVYNGRVWNNELSGEVINTFERLIQFCDASMNTTFRILQESGVID